MNRDQRSSIVRNFEFAGCILLGFVSYGNEKAVAALVMAYGLGYLSARFIWRAQ